VRRLTEEVEALKVIRIQGFDSVSLPFIGHLILLIFFVLMPLCVERILLTPSFVICISKHHHHLEKIAAAEVIRLEEERVVKEANRLELEAVELKRLEELRISMEV
jgi:hypothetical protein